MNVSAWRGRLERLARGRPLLLALDFDGTLAPIVARAHRATLPRASRHALWRLRRVPGLRLAILSGRSLPDLRQRLGLAGIDLVGNHGLSSNRRGLGLSSFQARRFRALVKKARSRLEKLNLGDLGAVIEDKGLGLTLHLRQVKPGQRRRLSRKVAKALSGLPLELRRGLEILELKPRSRWNKGSALRALLRVRATAWPRRGACVFAGDDSTDEDAFAMLRPHPKAALTFKVGPGKTRAQSRLRGPGQVRALLGQIIKLMKKETVL